MKFPWEKENKGNERIQWENEIEIPDQDLSKAHGQHILSQRRKLTTTTLTRTSVNDGQRPPLQRRLSHDNDGKTFTFIIDVEKTKKELLEQEDTDKNYQITIQDKGPKIFKLGTFNSEGFKSFEIRGTYQLSNLLQELELASSYGRSTIILDSKRLNENPLERLNRLIKYHFWDSLTRRMDHLGLEKIIQDPKNRQNDQSNRIYIPNKDDFGWDYYSRIAATNPHLGLCLERLPLDITPEYVKSINDKPGILSLALRHMVDQNSVEYIRGVPFVVPGGRFNEMYGWDSYFESLGLLADGRIELARGMVENFWYEIEHYNKILNANRSYYLTRTQPPFLTDMTIRVYDSLLTRPSFADIAREWMLKGIKACIKELFGVWLASPRINPATGLTTYHGEGIGIPPETEASHFDHILEPFAKKHNITITEFIEKYQSGEIKEPYLEEYFVHDRSVRESGHDTTYRFEKKCANVASIDLNSLIYKYEYDLSNLIKKYCNSGIRAKVRKGPKCSSFKQFLNWKSIVNTHGVEAIRMEIGWNTFWCRGLMVDDNFYETTQNISDEISFTVNDEDDYFIVEFPWKIFYDLAQIQKQLIMKYMWCPESNLFYDWDCSISMRLAYKSVTCLWPLWAECIDKDIADLLVPAALEQFKFTGGLVSGTEQSRGLISLDRPNRQWDFPFGWAPHQMLAWQGLQQYGFNREARECCYRWLYSIIKSFVGFNGVVPEKFDVVNVSHLVQVEYGNVGVDFKCVAREGFGWMNASFQVGLLMLDTRLERLLANLTHPDDVFK